MQTSELVRLTVKELQNLAKKLGIKEFSGVRKQDLIKLILEALTNEVIDKKAELNIAINEESKNKSGHITDIKPAELNGGKD